MCLQPLGQILQTPGDLGEARLRHGGEAGLSLPRLLLNSLMMLILPDAAALSADTTADSLAQLSTLNASST